MNHCLASVEKGAPNHDSAMVGRTETANSYGRGWGVRVRECVRSCVHACVWAGRDVSAIYDNNILPRLVMIIIKIISLYFIEIAQTGDFPSTRLV